MLLALRGQGYKILPEEDCDGLCAFQPIQLDLHGCSQDGYEIRVSQAATNLACDVATAAPAPWQAEASDVAERWLVDSGTFEDLVNAETAARYPHAIVEVDPKRVSTANGIIISRRALNTIFGKLASTSSQALILKNTPRAMAVGKRCNRESFCFLWLSRKRPFFIFPDGQIAILTVLEDLLILTKMSLSSLPTILKYSISVAYGTGVEKKGHVQLYIRQYFAVVIGKGLPSETDED